MTRFAQELENALQMPKKTIIRVCLILAGSTLISNISFAQSKEVELANEYFNRHDLEKSLELYDKLAKEPTNVKFIHANYLSVLSELKLDEKAEKYLKKLGKTFPERTEYKLELAQLYLKQKKDDKSKKVLDRLFAEIEKNPPLVESTAAYLSKLGLVKNAEDLFKQSRRAMYSPFSYHDQLAELYKKRGQTSLMIEEQLNFLEANPVASYEIQNTFQTQLTKSEELDTLQKKLFEKVQVDANNIIYNELLLWLYLQRKDFSGAFIQAKAIDRRLRLEAVRTMEVGEVSMTNRDYKTAINIFEYVAAEYKNTRIYAEAQRNLISAREIEAKSSYPVDKQVIRKIVKDYNQLINLVPEAALIAESKRNVALLYGHYLDSPDTAIAILTQALAIPRYNRQFLSKSKLDLGDMYLLKGEPWESNLLYSQVEKDEKDQPLGHEAKLRNAKLSYYKGEFELAQEHLDVLKLATSREIANDAMHLSLLIQDNTAFDTTGEALSEYSKVELLLFENKDSEALEKTDAMLKKYASHSLQDEIYWLRSKLFRKMKQYDKAIECLDFITKNYPKDIFGDDALFTKGLIYEDDLRNKEKAMEIYQALMKDYPASIFTAEARKKYRILRGDFVN